MSTARIRRAKVQKYFDICKYFLHIARNQHEIAENKYKEDRKNCYAGSNFQFVRCVFQILHLTQQFVGRLLQFDKAEPLLAKIFETCADEIDGVIDTQETVMSTVKLLYLYGRVLRIVFLKIKRRNISSTF